MRPLSGVTAPLSTFMSVLLPAPFSPISANTSPLFASSETCHSARVGPKLLLMSDIRNSAVCMGKSVGQSAWGGWSSFLISGSSMFSVVAITSPVSMRFSTGSPCRCATMAFTPS